MQWLLDLLLVPSLPIPRIIFLWSPCWWVCYGFWIYRLPIGFWWRICVNFHGRRRWGGSFPFKLGPRYHAFVSDHPTPLLSLQAMSSWVISVMERHSDSFPQWHGVSLGLLCAHSLWTDLLSPSPWLCGLRESDGLLATPFSTIAPASVVTSSVSSFHR